MILLGRKLVHPAIQTIALAILDFEDWHEGTTSMRNRNPGNLKYAGQSGVVGQDERNHCVFESFEAGWNALVRQLNAAFYGKSKVYTPQDSLFSFFQKYCEKNCGEYASFVAERLGVTPETTLQQIIADSSPSGSAVT